MGRARCRATSLFHVQLLLGCTALNVKRLAGRADAASEQAAVPAAQSTAEEAAADASGADRARHHPVCDIIAQPPIAHVAHATWTITLSMN